jgi:hypothetical protein
VLHEYGLGIVFFTAGGKAGPILSQEGVHG